ncbi:MAG: response regulator transcription factor [Oscillospiraceae bacterium]|jgi:DNA-binding response OmpR family regulator|nr:response regulator transcription factor [Oscillospiraceae bacterium]
MQKIFYTEDNPEISHGVKRFLEEKGFAVSLFSTMAETVTAMLKAAPDLFLIDWNLPDGNGGDLCRLIRQRWRNTPIIVITVNNQTDEIINGFHAGADDYITKPFVLEILLSRLQALFRRAGGEAQSILACGDISLDKTLHAVFLGEEAVALTGTEYQLLSVLMENKNRTVTRQSLLENLWDIHGNYVNDNTLTVSIKRLREKLKRPDCIKTIRSFGYRMEDT